MINKNKIFFATLVSFICLSTTTNAEILPISAGGDSRIKVVTYDPTEVVKIKAKAGVATHIILNNDENYQIHAFGDSDAWAFSNFSNNIFIKPKVENGSTNLVIITDRRNYNLYLEYTKNSQTYQVKFNYPEQIVAKNNKKILENNLNNRFEGKVINFAYYMRGSYTVKPINVWDDGTFTYFKFGNNIDLPAIYSVDNKDKNKESLYNRTVLGADNNIIMLHGISKNWRLRSGNSALDIQNVAFNEIGNDTSSGTISKEVERSVINQE